MDTFEKTDPALELSELLRVVLEIAGSTTPTWLVLSNSLGLDAKTEEYSDFLAAVLARISGLRAITTGIQGSQRLMERAARASSTADNLAHIFLSEGQAAPWSSSRTKLSVSDAINLANFSPEARLARPLRLIEPEERDAFLEKIDGAIEEIDASEVTAWTKAALLREAKRLRTTLKHIYYFGHEFASERTAVFAAKIHETKSAQKGVEWNLPKTYRLLMDLAAAFIVFNDISESAEKYMGWMKAATESISSQVGQASIDTNGDAASPFLPRSYPVQP